MSVINVYEISAETLKVIRAVTVPKGPVEIPSVTEYRWDELLREEEISNEAGEVERRVVRTEMEVPEISDELVDTEIAVVTDCPTLTYKLALPFRDERRLAQVVPIQIQDLVPFDTDQFVIDSFVGGDNSDGSATVFASLMQNSAVREAMSRLELLGANPKILTNPASLAASCDRVINPQAADNRGVLLVSGESYAIATFSGSKLEFLRQATIEDSEARDQELKTFIRSSAERFSRDTDSQLDRIIAIGGLDSDKIHSMGLEEAAPGAAVNSEYPARQWLSVLGLIADGGRKLQRCYFSYRKGEFSYRPSLSHLLGLFKEEGVYFIAAAVLAVAVFGAKWAVNSRELAATDQAIQQSIAKVLPGETLPPGGEVDELLARIDAMEKGLRKMGSLSALSPLDSLKELSLALPDKFDLQIDSMSLGQSRINIVGSVADFPAVGVLTKVLEGRPKKFCQVGVEPRGQQGSRVRVVADIKLCE